MGAQNIKEARMFVIMERELAGLLRRSKNRLRIKNLFIGREECEKTTRQTDSCPPGTAPSQGHQALKETTSLPDVSEERPHSNSSSQD